MKRFIIFLIMTQMLFTLTACKSTDTKKTFVKIDEYKSHNGYTVWLVYDPETKVEYFMRGDMMCPRYDENGNITFYGGN